MWRKHIIYQTDTTVIHYFLLDFDTSQVPGGAGFLRHQTVTCKRDTLRRALRLVARTPLERVVEAAGAIEDENHKRYQRTQNIYHPEWWRYLHSLGDVNLIILYNSLNLIDNRCNSMCLGKKIDVFLVWRRVPMEKSINTTESHQLKPTSPAVPHRASYQKCQGYSLGHAAACFEAVPTSKTHVMWMFNIHTSQHGVDLCWCDHI